MLKLDKLYHTCKFSTLTIDFSKNVTQDLGKQLNLMIRLENVLKTSLQDVLKTFLRRLEDVLKTFLQDVLKTYRQDEYIGLEQDIFNTSSEDEDENRLEDVFIKTNVSWVFTIIVTFL